MRIPLGPRSATEILAAKGQHIKTHEPQIISRPSITSQHRAADRREVLHRTPTALADDN
jgi:hypothetical protein